jgi:hypothetical protein
VVVHHLSKRQDYDDHLDAVSSSTGFTGAADTILILANGPQGPTLYGKGRDIEEIETALRFHRARGLWTALGEARRCAIICSFVRPRALTANASVNVIG